MLIKEKVNGLYFDYLCLFRSAISQCLSPFLLSFEAISLKELNGLSKANIELVENIKI